MPRIVYEVSFGNGAKIMAKRSTSITQTSPGDGTKPQLAKKVLVKRFRQNPRVVQKPEPPKKTLVIEKPKLFDEFLKTDSHECRLYYPHYRNLPTGLRRNRYLPMPNLLFLRFRMLQALIDGGRIYCWGMAVAVAQHSTPPAQGESLALFPPHASFGFICTDSFYHGQFPPEMSFDDMVKVFWSNYFSSGYFLYDDWEGLTLQQASERIPERFFDKYNRNMSFAEWIRGNTYR